MPDRFLEEITCPVLILHVCLSSGYQKRRASLTSLQGTDDRAASWETCQDLERKLLSGEHTLSTEDSLANRLSKLSFSTILLIASHSRRLSLSKPVLSQYHQPVHSPVHRSSHKDASCYSVKKTSCSPSLKHFCSSNVALCLWESRINCIAGKSYQHLYFSFPYISQRPSRYYTCSIGEKRAIYCSIDRLRTVQLEISSFMQAGSLQVMVLC